MEHITTTDPDLSARWEKVRADEQTYARIGNRAKDEKIRADADAKHQALVQERKDLEEQIAAAARIITVDRVAPKTWGRLVAEHPPRPGDAYDQQLGVNTDTFDAALMPLAITRVTDGNGDEVEWDWPALAEGMSPALFDHIITETIRVHMARDAVPFTLPASSRTQGSART